MVVFEFNWGELANAVAAKLMDEALGGHGVDFIVGGAGDEGSDAVEVEFFFGEVGKNVRANSFESEHLGGGDVFVIGVEEEDAVAIVMEDFGGLACPEIGPCKEDPGHVFGGEAEAACERRGGKAVDEHGSDDDKKN